MACLSKKWIAYQCPRTEWFLYQRSEYDLSIKELNDLSIKKIIVICPSKKRMSLFYPRAEYNLVVQCTRQSIPLHTNNCLCKVSACWLIRLKDTSVFYFLFALLYLHSNYRQINIILINHYTYTVIVRNIFILLIFFFCLLSLET